MTVIIRELITRIKQELTLKSKINAQQTAVLQNRTSNDQTLQTRSSVHDC